MPKFIALVAINVAEAPEAAMTDHLYNHILPTPRDLDWVRVDDGVEVDLEKALTAAASGDVESGEDPVADADKSREAIQWATETMTPGKAGEFLKVWLSGDAEAIKEKYPEIPEDLLV